MRPSPGAIPSPNIWQHPGIYELENLAWAQDGTLASFVADALPTSGREVLDIGCGSGFHLPALAHRAGQVWGLEPHPSLAAMAARRTRDLGNIRIIAGTAAEVPLPDSSIDCAHAQLAYFFGPGCEPGLSELDRIMRRGSRAVVIDNDASRSTFGAWFRRGYPNIDPSTVEAFWSTRGWQRHQLTTRWTFATRADFEAVIRIEFAPEQARAILQEHRSQSVDYALNAWVKDF